MTTMRTGAPWNGCLFIDGSYGPAASGKQTAVLEKATGARLTVVGAGGAADVDRAVAAAAAAGQEWAGRPAHERAGVLRRAARLLEARAGELADWIVRETGAISGKAQYEVSASAGYLDEAAALATRANGELLPSAVPGRRNLVQRRPVGVVAVISPWNFPLVLSAYVLAPAIALGNTVVLKPAPATPVTGGLLLADILREAGLPAGVLNVVPGADQTGEALVRHRDVQMIHFTGSTAVGRRIAEIAGRDLKRVSLELGGNNALVVLDDVDPEAASSVGAWSSFHYQGQTCITASRQIVLASVLGDYVAALSRRAAAISVGDPASGAVGLGPLVDEQQRDRAHAFLEESVAMGAKVVEGGRYDGLFYRPTVVVDVSPDMPLYREEIFAPIAPVIVAEDEEHALRLVNDTDYGLVNGVLTGDPWRGLTLAERMNSGMVHVNDTTCLSETAVPFGGTGASGLGEPTGGDANLEQFTKRRWISVRANLPAYPY